MSWNSFGVKEQLIVSSDSCFVLGKEEICSTSIFGRSPGVSGQLAFRKVQLARKFKYLAADFNLWTSDAMWVTALHHVGAAPLEEPNNYLHVKNKGDYAALYRRVLGLVPKICPVSHNLQCILSGFQTINQHRLWREWKMMHGFQIVVINKNLKVFHAVTLFVL